MMRVTLYYALMLNKRVYTLITLIACRILLNEESLELENSCIEELCMNCIAASGYIYETLVTEYVSIYFGRI